MNESLKSTDYKKNNHVIIVQIQTKNNPKKRWTKTIMNEIWLKPKRKSVGQIENNMVTPWSKFSTTTKMIYPRIILPGRNHDDGKNTGFFFVSYCLVNILVRHFYYLYWINFIVAPKKKVMIMIMIDHHHYHHQNRI